MNKRAINEFLAGNIDDLTLEQTLVLKEVMNTTRRGETATFTDDKVAWWLTLHGAKFKDFGFKYEIKGVRV